MIAAMALATGAACVTLNATADAIDVTSAETAITGVTGTADAISGAAGKNVITIVMIAMSAAKTDAIAATTATRITAITIMDIIAVIEPITARLSALILSSARPDIQVTAGPATHIAFIRRVIFGKFAKNLFASSIRILRTSAIFFPL